MADLLLGGLPGSSLCTRAGIIQVFLLLVLLLSPQHNKVLICVCRILDVPSTSWQEKAENIQGFSEEVFPWAPVTRDLTVPMEASQELQKSWP